jgi:hypothetical protein
MRNRIIAATLLLGLVVAGCGGKLAASSSEQSPPGDIPDNQAYVAYHPPGAAFTVKVPEGWSRSASSGAVTFTDKLNSIRIESAPAAAAPTAAQGTQAEVPKLAKTVKGFQAGKVGVVDRKSGKALRITYLADAQANTVTGKTGQDAVERYVFFHKGSDAILTLSGPKGADNVDPWKIVTDSVTWTR